MDIRTRGPGRRQSGVTLIEALVAFLVLSLGMLVIARTQMTLRLNADVAKQRSEAVRIAQEDMEQLRSFTQLGAGGGTIRSYDGTIATQTPTDVVGYTTNTTFRVSRAVVANTDPDFKSLVVNVAWTDRNGDEQSVAIRSVIGRTDPTMAAQMSIPSNSSGVRNPLNRNIRIPSTAVELGGGKSGYAPPGVTGRYFVFDNSNANVIENCTGTLSASAYAAIKGGDTSGGSCVTSPGYLLSGFINFDLRNNTNPVSPGSTVCDFYNDAQGAGLITTSPPLEGLSLSSLTLNAPSNAPPVQYQLNAVTVASNSTIYDGATGIAAGSDLAVSMQTSLNQADRIVLKAAGGPIRLERASDNSLVEQFGWSGESTSATSSVVGGMLTVGSTFVLTVHPGTTLTNDTRYRLVIPANAIEIQRLDNKGDIKDRDSIGATTIRFTTGPAPTLVSTSPSTGGVLTSLGANISLTFSEPVVAGVGIITLVKKGNGNNFNPVETFNVATGLGGSGGSVTFSGATVTLNPGADLTAGGIYAVLVERTATAGAITDVAGNHFAGIGTADGFTFTTTAATLGCPTVGTAMNFMHLNLQMTGLTYPSPGHECFSDAINAVTGGGYTIGYFCAVYAVDDTSTPTPALEWNGELKLTGPSGWLSGGSARYKVCRYFDADGDGVVPNEQHPAAYSHVTGGLTDQNFLVIKNTESCPDATVNVGSQTGIVVYYNTDQIQP